jgi:hypothetical protein
MELGLKTRITEVMMVKPEGDPSGWQGSSIIREINNLRHDTQYSSFHASSVGLSTMPGTPTFLICLGLLSQLL